jgi:hypothetical protein
MGKMEASWNLARQSLALLASDKELILLPLTSALIMMLTLALLCGWYAAAYWPELRALPPHRSAGLPHRGFLYVLLFLFYTISYFVMTFCNVALVAVANNRMGGGSWRMHQGLALAWQRRFTILQWAILAATVGIVLEMISERLGFLGKLLTRLVGLAWGLATYFIVPVLAFDNLSPIEAVRRSAQLFRKTWGENVAAGVSTALIFMIPFSLGLCLWFAARNSESLSPMALIAIGAVLLVYLHVVIAVMSATTLIYKVALYNYALGGRLHGGFSEEQFQSTWVPKS